MDSFSYLSSEPANELPHEIFQMVERFAILLFSRTSDSYDIDDTRMTLFTKMPGNIDNIPPTRAALEEHVRGAAYQAGYVWALSLMQQPVLPDPCQWGWRKDEKGFIPFWTKLPIAEKACTELVYCKCTKSCKGYCSLFKVILKCNPQCKCGGLCYQT